MRVGCTGTQTGGNTHQLMVTRQTLSDLYTSGSEFHHGDCVGVDVQLATMAQEIGYTTVSHPPSNPKRRAFHESDQILIPAPYMKRNQDVVDAVEVLIAVPKETREVVRSGTWSTVRRGRRKTGLRLILITP